MQEVIKILTEKKAIDEKIFEGKTSLVTVTMTGDKKTKSVEINPEALDDVEMLQDLIITCVNEALRKVDSAQAESFGKYNIPGF